MDSKEYTLTDLEEKLLSGNKQTEIKRIKDILLQEENRIKKLKIKGCRPNEFSNYNKELLAINAAYKILEVFQNMEIVKNE